MSASTEIHLTARAVEWLRAEADPVTYKTAIGTYACDPKMRGTDTVRVADVRAMVRGHKKARDWDGGVPFFRDIRRITCLRCIAIFETEASVTRQKHHLAEEVAP